MFICHPGIEIIPHTDRRVHHLFQQPIKRVVDPIRRYFAVWFDGANGGDGYYGGANEERRVDKKSYYDWPTTIEMVRELQPQAVIFSDAGPVYAGLETKKDMPMKQLGHRFIAIASMLVCPIFNVLLQDRKEPIGCQQKQMYLFVPDGITTQNKTIKSNHFLNLWIFITIQLGQQFVIAELPVDTHGLVHENEVANLKALAEFLKGDLAVNYAKGQHKTSTTAKGYSNTALLDDDLKSYWVSQSKDPSPTIELLLEKLVEVNTFMIQEYLLGSADQVF